MVNAAYTGVLAWQCCHSTFLRCAQAKSTFFVVSGSALISPHATCLSVLQCVLRARVTSGLITASSVVAVIKTYSCLFLSSCRLSCVLCGTYNRRRIPFQSRSLLQGAETGICERGRPSRSLPPPFLSLSPLPLP